MTYIKHFNYKTFQHSPVDNVLNTKVLMFYNVVFVLCVTQWCKSQSSRLQAHSCARAAGHVGACPLTKQSNVMLTTNQRVHDVCAPFKPFNFIWFCFIRLDVKL